MFNFTVLGHSPGYPTEKSGCSSFLVRASGGTILLDCGPGCLGPLQQMARLEDIDAVWISHLHIDHYLDIFPYALGLLSGIFRSDPDSPLRQIPLYIPEGMKTKLLEVSRALGFPAYQFPPIPDSASSYEALRLLVQETGDFFSVLFQLHEYPLTGSQVIGGLEITSREVAHNVPAAAVRISYEGKSLTYSSDTAVCPGLVELAQGSDVVLFEATESSPKFHKGSHMAVSEAAQTAAQVQAPRLVLTHLNPWIDPDWAIEEAKRYFSGKISCARVFDRYDF